MKEVSKNKEKELDKRINKKNRIIPYTIKMIFIFLLFFLLMQLTDLLNLSIKYGKYGPMFLSDLFGILFLVIIILISGKKYIFSYHKISFFESLKQGWIFLLIGFVMLLDSIYILIFKQQSFNFLNFISLILVAISIGIFEEFLFRGWFLNEFLEKFDKTTKGVFQSIVICSLFFGFLHLFNIIDGQSISTTVLQVVETIAGGFLYGAIYYRTKNLWACVFLHSFYDFSIMLGQINYIKDPYVAKETFVSILISFVLAFIYIVVAIQMIKEDKHEEEKNTYSNNRLDNNIVYVFVCVSILIFVSLFIPDNQNTKYYNYKEKTINESITHYVKYNNYYISQGNFNQNVGLSIYDQNDKVIINNTNTNDSIILKYNMCKYIVIENKTNFIIIIYDGSFNIYYALLNKNEMNNDKGYLYMIENSFKKYDVPELQDMGYLTIKGIDEKYPFLLGTSFEKFIIMDNDIFHLKK